MKELATPKSVNHTDTLIPPGDCTQPRVSVNVGEHAIGSSMGDRNFQTGLSDLPAWRMTLQMKEWWLILLKEQAGPRS